MPNSLGLSRSIPADVKRAVRQRCYFGCVVCAASIYQYDHLEPEFASAAVHDPKGIILLCPTCHELKKKGLLNLDFLKQKSLQPAARSYGASAISLPYFEDIPLTVFGGGVSFQGVPVPFQIDDVPILSFSAPEPGSSVTRVNAALSDPSGETMLRIVDNEWLVQSGVWDFEWVGSRMSIFDAEKSEALRLVIFAPHQIQIDKLMSKHDKILIKIDGADLCIDYATVIACPVQEFSIGLMAISDPKYEPDSAGILIRCYPE